MSLTDAPNESDESKRTRYEKEQEEIKSDEKLTAFLELERADNLSKAGWSWSCVSAIDPNGRTIWIADAHRDDGKDFVVHADHKARRVC